MTSLSSRKSKIGRNRREGIRAYKPTLRDFERRGSRSNAGRDRNDGKRALASQRSSQTRRMDDIFGNFRKNIEDMMMPWSSVSQPYLFGPRFPFTPVSEDDVDEREMVQRMPIFDMVDKEDSYELKVEVPGIEKEKIKVIATNDSVEISGEQTTEEGSEDKRTRYVYNERSYSTFYRSIPMPEEIVSSKARAKLSNGILHIELPKKNATRLKKQNGTTIEIT